MNKEILTNIDNIIHISHTDLDGYGCQYISTEFINKLNKDLSKNIDITYFNASYDSILENINKAFEIMLNDKNKKYFILITDLSLKENMIKKINNFLKGNKNISCVFQVLDHHKSAEEVINLCDYYQLDLTICATKATYKYFENICQFNDKILSLTSDVINAHDLWLENDIYFYKANFLADILNKQIKYLDILFEEERTHKFFMLSQYINLIYNNKSIEEIEDSIYKIQRNYINSYKEVSKYFKNIDIAYEHKLYFLFFILIKKNQNKLFQSYVLDNKKFFIFYNIGSTYFQYISHYYLDNNNEYDFVVHLTNHKTISLRSKDEVNVEEIARKYFDGGGHKHAAGGTLYNPPFSKDVQFLDQKNAEKYFQEYFEKNYQINLC